HPPQRGRDAPVSPGAEIGGIVRRHPADRHHPAVVGRGARQDPEAETPGGGAPPREGNEPAALVGGGGGDLGRGGEPGRALGARHGPEGALESRLGQTLSLGALELIRSNERLARRQHRESEDEDGKEGQRDHRQGQRRAPLVTRDAKLLHRAVMRVMRDTALLSAASPEAATGRYATLTVIWPLWGEVIEPQPGGALHSTIRTWRE